MVHKGIEYEIAMIEPGVWKYQFRIGAVIRTGKTKSSLELLADRRVRQKIDRLLRQPPASQGSGPSTRMASVLDGKGNGRPSRPVKTRGSSPDASGT
jgi:hypothetical protein